MRYRGELNRNLGSLLKTYFGTDKRSLYELERKTGIKVRTIRSHMAGKSGPYFEDLCSYIREGGPEFVTALLLPHGYRALPLEGEEADGCYHAIAAEASKLPLEISEAHSNDGFVDHQENRRIVMRVISLIPKLGRFLAVRRVQTQ